MTNTNYITDFTKILDSKFDTLQTKWNQIESLKNSEKTEVNGLFIDVEKYITSTATMIKEDEILLNNTSIYKINVDLLNDYMMTLDPKKDGKKMVIVDLLLFINGNKLKVYTGTYTNKKGIESDMLVPLSIFKNLAKYEDFINSTDLKTARKLHKVDGKTLKDNSGYISALKSVLAESKLAYLNQCKSDIEGVQFLEMTINQLESLKIVLADRIAVKKSEEK